MATTPHTRDWAGPDSAVCRAVERFSADCLRTYEVDVRRISEDANIEKIATEGGYARRQLYELIQNGADELIERRGRIEVVLTEDALYCANEGRPVTEQGVGAILGSHNSTKSGVEIGRFGLGFKSVLGVSRTPAVYSTTGSFGFDAERNLDAVRRIAPDATRAAVLRLAAPLDPVGAAADDPVLTALMGRAETIVVVPRDTGAVDWLNEAIREFPREFLLFSSHVEQLVLDDRTGDGFRRVIELEEADAGLWELHERGDEGGKTAWRLFTTTHSPSEAVKRDGGTMAERPIIPLHWAVPISRPVPGRLWAFFPTTVATTLSGVINAPWKLDESRTTLVPGEFNEELLRAVVELVVENLDAVNREGDPGYFLELLPGRGKELKGWADEVLSTAIYDAAAAAPSLPDQRGVLQAPASLRLLPSTVSGESAEVWAAQPTRPVSWVHPSAIRNATRRSRAERLLESAQVQPSTEEEWLEALIAKKSARGSIAALKVAASVAYSEADNGMRKARIVLTSAGKLTRPVRGAVYLPATVDVDVDVPLVASEVLEDVEALQSLRDLKIAEVSGVTVLEALVDRAISSPAESRDWNWAQIWGLARRVSETDLAKVLLESHQLEAADVFVKSMAGGMVRLSTVLLPGDLLSPQDFKASHRALLVDVDHHRRELSVLRRLGATDRPLRGGGSQDEPWLAEYRRMLIARAIDEARTHGARVRPEHYELIAGGPWGGPSTPLDGLSDEAAARYARELLVVTETLEPWTLRRNKGRVIDVEVEHPILWRVRQLGVLETDMGLRPIDDCITSHLRAMTGLLPVADIPRPACRAFHLPDTVDELDAGRVSLALEAFGDLDREDAIGAAYSALLPMIVEPPAHIRAMVRREATWVSPVEACASYSVSDTKVLRGTGTPFVRFDTEEVAERFVAAWGLQRIADVIASKVVAIPDGERELAVDLYPLLRFILGRTVEKVEFLPCRELHREMYTEQGSISEPLDFELRDDVAYHVSTLSEVDRVRRLSERLGKPLSEDDAREVLENAQAAEVQALLKQVRAAANDTHRLLLLVGADALRSRIPSVVLDAVEETDGDLDDLRTAELALTVFGIETLKEYRDALVERGLSPPGKWAGLRPAVRFVTEELGFPRKYAGFADVRVEDTLEVAGPSPLPPLHPFQDLAAEAIRSLIARQTNRRGLLSLPTGAGKTRVAVEALIGAMADDEVASPVLWIAQTMELCEQAVQSWAEVWRAAGPDRSLRISRLWSGYSAEPRQDDGDQVVVATLAKLTQCTGNDAYDWLSRAGCVVVDEAHTSTAPSYTQLFGWARIDRSDDHAPLIGLSATPFRGVSVEETDRLAARYGRHRLDEGIFGEEVSISLLQRERILARVDHQILEGSEQVPLTSAEREHIKTLRSLPPSVLEKIGRDLDRTNRLVESVMNLPGEWPVLMFAASVAHAGTLAALITRRGRTAAAISGDTPAPVRRHLVAEFRAGRLQTLINYGVLTQGFDAPSIRALYIARPTYSPNLYQQMIGRGLRRPENGGKESCLVVDVADNVVAYGLELAFRDFEYVWKT